MWLTALGRHRIVHAESGHRRALNCACHSDDRLGWSGLGHELGIHTALTQAKRTVHLQPKRHLVKGTINSFGSISNYERYGRIPDAAS